MAHPTRFERVTFAFGGQSLRYQWRHNAFDQSQESDVASPATTPQGASLRRVTLPCEKRAMVLHVVDRRQVACARCSIELLTPSRSDATVCGGGARKGYPRECGAPAPAGH